PEPSPLSQQSLPPAPTPLPSPIPAPAVKPEPPALSAEWFRKNLETYQDKAIDNPSPENVAAYYYLQRVMMDKASRFTDVARQVVQSDPLLDANTRRPLATFAVHEADQRSVSATEQALTTIAQHAGILFFFRSDCRYCHIQAPLLALLEERFGFKIYPVSLDGQPMPGPLYRNFHTDQGQARSLGIQATPALFLMQPPDDLRPLSQGVLSFDDLTGRIILAGKESGIIDEGLYESTRGQRQEPSRMSIAATALTPETLRDSRTLIEALRQSSIPQAFPDDENH
ncbi:MAG: conjugal transfer protein TraF, partial [Methylococcaceae bacterium]|nr:conjugal transfer protein TraF [Methylococcaceae bacterium]